MHMNRKFQSFGWLLAALLCVAPLARALDTTAATPAALEARRAAFIKLLDRPRVAPAPEVKTLAPVDGMSRFHFWIRTEATERVPGYVLLPDEKKWRGDRPVVIALHGTGGNKDNEGIVDIVKRAAQAGFVAVAIDGRFHGERTQAGSGAAEYNDAIAKAYTTGEGHPFFYDTAWDVMRLIDWLATIPDVDVKRIGLTGISKGGIETYLTAAADPRVAAAVPYIGVQSFKWALDNGQWRARIATIQGGFNRAAAEAKQSEGSTEFVRAFYQRVVPGIDGEFDGPAMLALIAPRALLVVNSDSDANTPLAGVRLAVNTAKPVYVAANAADRLQLLVQENTAHKVNTESVEAGIAWFVRWLKP
jgi:dienelactone hydrolase